MLGTRRAFPDRSVVETVGTTASPLRFHRGQKPRTERLRIWTRSSHAPRSTTMRTVAVLLVTLLTCVAGGPAVAKEGDAAEKEAAEVLKKQGYRLTVGEKKPGQPVIQASLYLRRLDSAGLEALKQLKSLEALTFYDTGLAAGAPH